MCGIYGVEFILFQTLQFIVGALDKDSPEYRVSTFFSVPSLFASASGCLLPLLGCMIITLMNTMSVSSLLILQRLLSHLERQVPKAKTKQDIQRLVIERVALGDHVIATSKALQHYLGPVLISILVLICALLSLSFSYGSELQSDDDDTPQNKAVRRVFFIVFTHEYCRNFLLLLIPTMWIFYQACTITQKLDLFKDIVAAQMQTAEKVELFLPLKQVSDSKVAFTVYGLDSTRALFYNLVAILVSVSTVLIRNLLKS